MDNIKSIKLGFPKIDSAPKGGFLKGEFAVIMGADKNMIKALLDKIRLNLIYMRIDETKISSKNFTQDIIQKVKASTGDVLIIICYDNSKDINFRNSWKKVTSFEDFDEIIPDSFRDSLDIHESIGYVIKKYNIFLIMVYINNKIIPFNERPRIEFLPVEIEMLADYILGFWQEKVFNLGYLKNRKGWLASEFISLS